MKPVSCLKQGKAIAKQSDNEKGDVLKMEWVNRAVGQTVQFIFHFSPSNTYFPAALPRDAPRE